jgi:Mce-associated membrane protein
MTARGSVVAIALHWLVVIAAGVTLLVRAPASPDTGALTDANTMQAVAAARAAIRTISSYDYRSIDSDIAAAKADTTGDFAKQYASAAPRLLAESSQLKAIVQATVGFAGVVSASPNDVVVLLFVDQATVREPPGSTTPTTRIDQIRVQVTMTRVGDRWLVSTLSLL